MLFENEQLIVSASKGECVIEMEGVFNNVRYLTLENKTETPVQVSFNKELYYNGNCHGCDSGTENTVVLSLPGKETMVGKCALGHTPLVVFESFQKRENKSRLTDLKVSNVKVEVQK